MFLFYHLFHRYVPPSSPSAPASSEPPAPSSKKDRAIFIWFAIFGLSLFFRPVAEFALRFLLFSACILLVSTLDGALNLLVGHAVLRAATSDNGYHLSPMLSSLDAGSLGGIFVIGPTTLMAVCLMALLGAPKRPQILSMHVIVFLELTSLVAVTAAACALGVTVVRSRRSYRDDNGPVTTTVAAAALDATHAAQAGALGACLLTVPIASLAAFLMREADTTSSSVRHASSEPTLPSPLALENLMGGPTPHAVASGPRTRTYRHVIAHTAVETVGYVLVTLCILTVRLLCI